jgi:hypothetical protein
MAFLNASLSFLKAFILGASGKIRPFFVLNAPYFK